MSISDEIRDEILKYSGAPLREDGDIDYEQIMETLECSYDQARAVGERMVDSGDYIVLEVRDNERRRRLNIFRKVVVE